MVQGSLITEILFGFTSVACISSILIGTVALSSDTGSCPASTITATFG